MKADNILVVSDINYGKPINNLGRITTNLKRFVREPETFKLVLFTGGSDVSPNLYGETSPKTFCGCDPNRDRKERIIFKRALRNNIKMTGICRGMQFLNVMSGGRMIHHLNDHAVWGKHPLECSKNEDIIEVNSLHHQMAIPPHNGYIIGWCPIKRSKVYFGDKDLPVNWPGPEVEALYLPKIQACGVQWHPEMMSEESDGFIFFNEMIDDFLGMETKRFSDKYTGRAKEKDKIIQHTT